MQLKKKPFSCLYFVKGQILQSSYMHLKLEPSWDVKACIMPLADLYAVPKCDILDGILSQWLLSSTACITFVFVLQPLERLGRSIMKKKEVPNDLLVISCEEDYETCTPLLEKGQNHLHHTLHTISVWESRQSANIHEYPRCHHFQHRASTKWYSHPEAGVRKVNKHNLFKTIETDILSINFPP